MDFGSLGKWLIIVGLGLAGLGLLFWLAGKWGLPLGTLPGDIHVDRPGFSFRFPVVTCIILSLLITILINVIIGLFRK
jgi:hypothetical protein